MILSIFPSTCLGALYAALFSKIIRIRIRIRTSGEVGSHKLPGVNSGHVCSEGLLQGQRQFSHSTGARQQDFSGLCKSHGGLALLSSHLTLDMVSGERDNIISKASTGGRQLHGRSGILDNPLFSRMAAQQGCLCGPDARSASM